MSEERRADEIHAEHRKISKESKVEGEARRRRHREEEIAKYTRAFFWDRSRRGVA